MFVGKARSLPWSRCSTWVGSGLANIRLGWNSLAETKALVYYEND